MSNKSKQWGAIIIMIALFAMIAFVTNLCSPMAVIVKNQFGASNLEAQIGNYGNFIAYLIMGIPSGMLIKKFGYKATALMALVVGIIGIFVQWMSGWESMQNAAFAVYLVGAFIAGFCMCMLNTVVNPMLNILGGGGNKGNQLIQIGGVFNSPCRSRLHPHGCPHRRRSQSSRCRRHTRTVHRRQHLHRGIRGYTLLQD